MWSYLEKLPPTLSFALLLILIIVAVVAIVIIAIKGKLIAKWGKNAIGIGGSSDNKNRGSFAGTGDGTSTNISSDTTTEVRPPAPPGTVFVEKKRSCTDCLEIVLSKRDKFDFNKKLREDKILTYRMNYTEEKLLEFENNFLEQFEGRIDEFSDSGHPNKEIESKMFYGLFKEALYKVKKEIRRSYKENGFNELGDIDFLNFVRDKTKVLISILVRNLRNIYPTHSTLIHIDSIVEDIESRYDSMHEYIKDIFTYAKQVIAENEKETEEMKKEFKNWIKKFIE